MYPGIIHDRGSHWPILRWLSHMCRRCNASGGLPRRPQLSIVSAYSRRERYVINPTKTTITVYPGNNNKSNSNKISSWKLGSTEIHPTDSFTYLGISRNSEKLSPDELISQRIQLALMGAGLHGTNGISPVIAWRMYLTYVLPRLLYNPEVRKLTATQVTRIEQFHRSTLRAIQGLPDRTSSAVTSSATWCTSYKRHK